MSLRPCCLFFTPREMRRDDAMECYLVYMSMRLLEIHRVLKRSGAIYLHCDPTASHYLKIAMDAVFGWDNYRNEITWRRSSVKGHAGESSKTYGVVTDKILFYAKSDAHKIKVPRTQMKKDGSAPGISSIRIRRGFYRAVTTLWGDDSLLGGASHFEWNGVKPRFGWRVSRDTLEKLHREDKIHYNQDGAHVIASSTTSSSRDSWSATYGTIFPSLRRKRA